MSRYLAACGCFIVFTNFVSIVNMIAYNCIHDEIVHKNNTGGYFGYKTVRSKRESIESFFEPLQIHIHIDDTVKILPDDVYFHVNVAINRVTEFLSKTIKVRHSASPFLLERTNCIQIWKHGLNKGRCSRIKSRPEFCSSKDTDFTIPDEYLDKLEVYNNVDSAPVSSISQGNGVEGENFILFVISRTTSWCQNAHVQAYGTFCRLDETNRPIAGLLNLCPEKLSKALYKLDHYINIITHEMIHILGFSKHLYPKFKTCSSRFDCEVPKQILTVDQFGIHRLIFPEVLRNMQQHFNCSDAEFGGPLENPSLNSPNEYTSHWHPLLMYSSIMTPTIQQDDYVVIDNITLALLASTGWYKIDFSNVQTFLFGKDEGCNFGFTQRCNDSKYLCDTSHQIGYNLSDKTIAKCEKISWDHPCGVFKSSHEVPKCVALGCKNGISVDLILNGTTTDCLYTYMDQANTELNCSNYLSFCITKEYDTAKRICDFSRHKFALPRQIFFTSPSTNDVLNNNISKEFEVQIIQAIASHVGIPASHVTSSSFLTYESVYFNITTCTPQDMKESELETIATKVHKFLKSSTFVTIFKNSLYIPVAATNISVNPALASEFSDYEGFHAIFIVLIVCAVLMLTAFIALLIRRAITQRHMLKRGTVELHELNEITLSTR